MMLKTLPVGMLQVNCYILGSETTREAIVIDPGDKANEILAAVRRQGWTVSRILATHAHFDHLLAWRQLQEITGAPFYVHQADVPLVGAMQKTCMAWLGYDPGEPPEITGYLVPGEVVEVGDIRLEVRHTPGHSPGGVTLVDHANERAFTGDALFAGSIGRTDFPGSSLKSAAGGHPQRNPDASRQLCRAVGPRAGQHGGGRAADQPVPERGGMVEEVAFELPEALAGEIVAHAREGWPEEVCGLISGKDGAPVAVHRGRNISPTPRVAYELDHETLALLMQLEDEGLELVGIYHSHPQGPEGPSETDVRLAYYPEAVYVIVSLVEPGRAVVRAFRIPS